jgi:NitT/TauT family transport system permease protein
VKVSFKNILSGKSPELRVLYGYLITIVLFIFLIELGHRNLPPYLFPSAIQIYNSTVKALSNNFGDLIDTLWRLILALLTATVAGWFLGLLMGAFRRTLSLVALPTLTILQAVPALSWVLIASLWISSIEIRIWFICFIVGLPLYAISVYEGVRDLDSDLLEAVDQFRPNKWQIIKTLLLPQSIVYLLISMKSISSLVLRILVFAELIGANTGVGAKMGHAQTDFQMGMIFAWTLIMIVTNFVILWVIEYMEKWLLVWRKEGNVR